MPNNRDLERRAMQYGLASSYASLSLSSVLQPIARKIVEAHDDKGDGPSDAELAELRRRYLVYRALDDHQKATWSAYRTNQMTGYEELYLAVFGSIYRLVVFVAASLIIYQHVIAWR